MKLDAGFSATMPAAGELWAIVPVKSLSASKRRLAQLLSPEQRALLVGDLMRHVLGMLSMVPDISRTIVISSDPDVWAMADELGAAVIPEVPPPDLNTAVAQAYAVAAGSAVAGVLILPVDLPFVTSAEISLLIETGRDQPPAALGVLAIAPDKDGTGTNALFLRPPAAYDFHFGPQSLQRHIDEALKREVAVRLVYTSGLQFDLDTVEDLLSFQAAVV